MQFLKKIAVYAFSVVAAGFIATPSLALTSMCVKVSGTVARWVTWAQIEAMTFQSTLVRFFAEGPKPPGGIEAFNSWPTDTAQLVGHFVGGVVVPSKISSVLSWLVAPRKVISNPDSLL